MHFILLLCLLTALLCLTMAQSVTYPILVGYYVYDLYGSDPNDFSVLTSYWNVTSPRSSSASKTGYCGTIILLGGTALLGPSTIIQKTYTGLPSHSYISYILRAVNINQWATSSDSIAVYIDDTLMQTLHPRTDTASTYQGDCGNANKDFIWYDVVGVQSHSANTLTVKYVLSNSGYTSASYGIHNLNILFRINTPYYTSKLCYDTPNSLSSACGTDGQHYKISGSSSTGTCDSTCDTCFGPGPQNCFGCGQNAYFNGTICQLCDSSCGSCSGIAANQCTRCNDGYYLQADNNTCTQNCTFPYAVNGTGAFKICYSPCDSSEYIFYDPATNTTTCRLNCTSPYSIVDFDSNTSQCILCQSNQYRTFDSTGDLYCSNNCTTPYFVKNTSYCLLCDFGTYISYNSSGQQICVRNCGAPYQVMNKNTYCLICPLGQYISYNSSGQLVCVTNCTAPYQVMNNNKYCLLCPLNQYISYNSSGSLICVSNCTAPYQLMSNNMYCLLCPLNRYISYSSSGQLNCVSNCATPYQVMNNNMYCLICPLTQFIFYNTSGQPVCVQNCTALPYQPMNNNLYCLTCPLNQYISYNSSGQQVCVGNCTTSPYQMMNNNMYCLICPLGQFISYDLQGQLTCLQNCTTSPYQLMNNNKYCLICSMDEYIAFNSTTGQPYCVENCTSPYYIKNRLYCIKSESDFPATPAASADGSNMASDILNALGQSETISIAIASFLGSSNPATAMIAAVFKILSYIKYIRINYPSRLQRMLDSIASSLITFNFAPPIDDSIEAQFELETIPSNFSKYELHSSFLVNYWQTMITLALILAIILILSIVEYLFRSYKDMSRLMGQILLVVRWNFFLITFCGNFDQVILYSSLDLRSLKLHSLNAILSLLVCLFFVSATIYTFRLMILIVRDVRAAVSRTKVIPMQQVPPGQAYLQTDDCHAKVQELNAVILRHKAFQLFFKGYKDDRPIQKYFMFIYSLRLCLFYAIIAFLFDYPLVQAFLLLFLGTAMLAFIFKLRPFRSKLASYQFHMDEIGIFINNICLLTLALLDYFKRFDCINVREFLGDTIIYTSIAVSISDNACTVGYIILGVKNAYENTKKYKSLGIVSWLVIFVSPYESAGMDVDLIEMQRQQDRHNSNKLVPPQSQYDEAKSQPGIVITTSDPPVSTPQGRTLANIVSPLSLNMKEITEKRRTRRSFQRSIAIDDASSVNSIDIPASSLLSPPEFSARESNRRMLIRQGFQRSDLIIEDINTPRSLIINADSPRTPPTEPGSYSRRQILREEFQSAGLLNHSRNSSETRSPSKMKIHSHFRFFKDGSIV